MATSAASFPDGVPVTSSVNDAGRVAATDAPWAWDCESRIDDTVWLTGVATTRLAGGAPTPQAGGTK